MEKMDLLLTNGKIVTSDETFSGAIGVKDGKIAFIGQNALKIEAKNVIDVAGKYILPGVIDPHIHFQDPGFTEREDFNAWNNGCGSRRGDNGIVTSTWITANNHI